MGLTPEQEEAMERSMLEQSKRAKLVNEITSRDFDNVVNRFIASLAKRHLTKVNNVEVDQTRRTATLNYTVRDMYGNVSHHSTKINGYGEIVWTSRN
ncbi:TPA: hypothetical protein QB624_000372 [Pasteurella multocida]|nr:hypothetical protein [Pasteurella multocida]